MRTNSFSAAAVLSVAIILSSVHTARADHLQCFKVKDDAAGAKYSATLTPSDPSFAPSPGCTLKAKAKLLCIDVVKSEVTPAPPGAPAGTPAGLFLCYKVKCAKTSASFAGADQFGEHNLEATKTSLLCAPVVAEPASTTTTTTAAGCETAGDCPGIDSECQTRVCTAGSCGFFFTGSGTPVSSQEPGDCRKVVCDGKGATTPVVDDSDIPPDEGNPCTSESCSDGAPQHAPVVPGTGCNQNGGTSCAGDVCVSICSDGFVGGEEVCDDGNEVDGDGCDSNCLPTGCGNGILTMGEQCDDGNDVDGDGCDSICVPTGCGNGIVTMGEQCDDGGVASGDGCDFNCMLEP